ncbi:MAG: FtsX-like permease family protein [Buchnera aphidicola (Nurudea yanoniella)]
MNLFISFFIGSRYLFSFSKKIFNKFTGILSIVIMSFGISSVITVLSIMNGFENELQNNILKFVPHILISNSKGSMNMFDIDKSNIVSHDVINISDVIFRDVIVQSNFAMSIGLVTSINKKYNEFTPYLKNKNSLNYLKTGYYNAIIGKRLANQLNINIGDTLRLITKNTNAFSFFKSILNNHKFTLIDTFSTNNNVDNYQILVNQEDLSQFLQYPKNHITGLRIWLKDPLHVTNFLKNFHILNCLKIENWKDSQGEILQAAKIEKYMMTLLFSLIILISIFSLMVFVSLFIVEKERDIAIFQTLGLSKWNIMLIFIYQGLLSGILSILLGMLFSFFMMNETFGIVSILKKFYTDFYLPYSIVPYQIIIINFIFITCIFLSIIYPSWKITQLYPSKRLAYE